MAKIKHRPTNRILRSIIVAVGIFFWLVFAGDPKHSFFVS